VDGVGCVGQQEVGWWLGSLIMYVVSKKRKKEKPSTPGPVLLLNALCLTRVVSVCL